MDEEVGVKAPVTRLRRRLSTEAEGSQSPLTPSTPTKKRGTRLAKQALELIEENGKSSPLVAGAVAKRVTRRASVKDVDSAEETPLTPSRRSTRLRSNTSLILEATQNAVADSPRARRALRRASQIGSDTESTTPARQTRKTRKDSTSSVEKLAVTNSNEKAVPQVAETISEEPEKEIKENYDSSGKSTPLRKSPRIKKMDEKSNDEHKRDNNEKLELNEKTNDSVKLTDEISSSPNELMTIEKATTSFQDNADSKFVSEDTAVKNLSQNSAKIINEINTNANKSMNTINKTISTVEEMSNDKGNRKRTKSWTTLTASDSPIDNINSLSKFASGDCAMDKIEIISPKKAIQKSSTIFNTSIDNKENMDMLKSIDTVDATDTIKILGKPPGKDIQSFVFMEDSDSNNSSVGKLTMDIPEGDGQKIEADDQCVPVVKEASSKKLSESFTVEPMDIDETIPENVTLNDFSDKSNSSKDENKELGEGQNTSLLNEKCFDINRSLNKSTRTSSISLNHESNNSKQKSFITASEQNFDDSKAALNKSDRSIITEKSQRKSSISSQCDSADNLGENTNKSKRKSSLSKAQSGDKRKLSTGSQVVDVINESSNKSNRKSVTDTEKTSNENKSTLVLSQLKDVSANETSNVAKSPNETKDQIDNDLSKSLDIPAKGTDKKNSNYITSTPLQQKSLQKLAMQINTSVITPKTESKNTSKINKSKTPVNKITNESASSTDDSDEDSKDKSKMIDDEAEEASDDYESGDSRNNEERQYEKDHEVLDMGETLESEHHISNDSDYEKDSFVVSSDEEDEDLLSGSGDDLSLSDNELKMTAKSKKKFDYRKRKQQKNASREMFEARHKLDAKGSNSKSKSKKIESSASESEKEQENQPKKKNRLRIDSSQNASMDNEDADESVIVKKKKTKRLSSMCEDNLNEKEITFNNLSASEKNDPLAAAIKQEPKTPQKIFNISTVQINDNTEQVQVDTNASVFKPNETSDPLQTTVAQKDDDSDSDISENIEIKENYDSVLENLNKNIQKKNKTHDISLNFNMTTKEKPKEPTIDHLNLMQTKKSRKSRSQPSITAEATEELKIANNEEAIEAKDDGENSDFIDMRLLFSEESNDSEANGIEFKRIGNNDQAEKFIPLKRTEGKTNIRECLGDPEDTNLDFFIDTKGAYEDIDTSTQNSGKKNKKKHKLSLSEPLDQVDATASSLTVSEEPSVNDSQKKDKKKKKKNKSLDVSQSDKTDENLLDASTIKEGIFASEVTADESLMSSEKKKKKKKNKSLLDVSQIAENEAPAETSINVLMDSHKKNKNKLLQDISQTVQNAALEESPVNVSSDCHKKKKSTFEVSNNDENAADHEVNVSLKSDKKKKKYVSVDTCNNEENIGDPEDTNLDFFIDTKGAYEDIDTSTQNSAKKNKKKHKLSLSEPNDQVEAAASSLTVSEEPSGNGSQKKDKKKKKRNKSLDVSQTDETNENILDASSINERISASEVTADETLISSEKKKKKKKNKSLLDDFQIAENEAPAETSINVLMDSHKKNKNKLLQDISQTVQNAGEDSDDAPVEVAFKSEKKSNNPELVQDDDTLTKSKNKFKKKKKKNKSIQEAVLNADQRRVKKRKHGSDSTGEVDDESQIPMRQNKMKKFAESYEPGVTLTQEATKSKSKKRRATDVESAPKNTKVFKGNFFEKIHVPRLPDSIINQLDDQPYDSKGESKKKIKAISTLPFVVEEGPRRKNKPSTYLEQSIYLNDSISPEKQKQKPSNKVPKVLPFTPTAIISEQGYTSNFKINVLPQNNVFAAQASNIPNYREKKLLQERKKKLKVARFKKQRSHNLTKF